jgi:hypothetical protein
MDEIIINQDLSISFFHIPSWLQHDVIWLGSTESLLHHQPNSLNLVQKTIRLLMDGQLKFSEDHIRTLAHKRQAALGRYVEFLVQTVISLAPDVGQCFSNVIIHDGKRTCGELDLIYQYGGRWIHLELAVKFYLGLGDRTDPFQWIGPAARDKLARKLSRFYDHQMTLPQSEAGRAVLADLNIDEVETRVLLMGGYSTPCRIGRPKYLMSLFLLQKVIPKAGGSVCVTSKLLNRGPYLIIPKQDGRFWINQLGYLVLIRT